MSCTKSPTVLWRVLLPLFLAGAPVPALLHGSSLQPARLHIQDTEEQRGSGPRGGVEDGRRTELHHGGLVLWGQHREVQGVLGMG